MNKLYFSDKHKEFYTEANDSLVCKDERIPILNGIPRFVPEENYAPAFGEQLNRFQKTQLDSYSRHTLSKDRSAKGRGHVRTTRRSIQHPEVRLGVACFAHHDIFPLLPPWIFKLRARQPLQLCRKNSK